MKFGVARSTFVALAFFLFPVITSAQDSGRVKLLVRVYEDNDGIKFGRKIADGGYTNGTRLDVFYVNKRKPHFFLDKLAPGFGGNAVYASSWGAFQVMITPLSVGEPAYKPVDYPYSGALTVHHSMYAFRPDKKDGFQTEWVLGVMGPPSLAKQTQKMIHGWFNFTRPRGWAYQYRTDLLLNYNLTYEKQLTHVEKGFEVIAGGKVNAGTMLNAVETHVLLRTGNMSPYFDGLLDQYAHKEHAQFYINAKPSVQYVVYNSLLQGGLFSDDVYVEPAVREAAGNAVRPPIRRWLADVDISAVLSLKRFAVSFSQKFSTPEFEGLPAQNVGNISLYLGF
ncbi:lipid A deacylase LpxR family protein [Chitinophaga horti]|uniref:Lipid A deacylase LpxR family protein n=1 Tax=Chitinophaga horti TaxID=2920382 RepID=A0ABY6J316_9BACT|nr:lipid A deacylase LpxR family protein [Chitinophaga horti]UYQ94056.1 lipid A deacylase LpxR family protein [Chitinophaga horti]